MTKEIPLDDGTASRIDDDYEEVVEVKEEVDRVLDYFDNKKEDETNNKTNTYLIM